MPPRWYAKFCLYLLGAAQLGGSGTVKPTRAAPTPPQQQGDDPWSQTYRPGEAPPTQPQPQQQQQGPTLQLSSSNLPAEDTDPDLTEETTAADKPASSSAAAATTSNQPDANSQQEAAATQQGASTARTPPTASHQQQGEHDAAGGTATAAAANGKDGDEPGEPQVPPTAPQQAAPQTGHPQLGGETTVPSQPPPTTAAQHHQAPDRAAATPATGQGPTGSHSHQHLQPPAAATHTQGGIPQASQMHYQSSQQTATHPQGWMPGRTPKDTWGFYAPAYDPDTDPWHEDGQAPSQPPPMQPPQQLTHSYTRHGTQLHLQQTSLPADPQTGGYVYPYDPWEDELDDPTPLPPAPHTQPTTATQPCHPQLPQGVTYMQPPAGANQCGIQPHVLPTNHLRTSSGRVPTKHGATHNYTALRPTAAHTE